jgi:SAM-dependent methyltransferase
MSVTGERAVTGEGGFNPSWQRHVSSYALTERFLPQGKVLDLGCGTGHSYELLAPRETVGVDIADEILDAQDRETIRADMRDLPIPSASFSSVIASHSIEHVPDPDRVLAQIARVLESDGLAALITPNRLTFGKPDEVIDPYHYIEFDPEQLRALCAPWFETVEIYGIFGSPQHLELVAEEHVKLDKLLSKDPLRIRRLIPRGIRQKLYDWKLSRERLGENADPRAAAITVDDFELGSENLDSALDLVAVGRFPIPDGNSNVA